MDNATYLHNRDAFAAYYAELEQEKKEIDEKIEHLQYASTTLSVLMKEKMRQFEEEFGL